MRHSLHNSTLAFSPTCFPLIPTAHSTSVNLEISCIVQLDNTSVGAAIDLFLVVTQSQKRFQRITRRTLSPQVLTGIHFYMAGWENLEERTEFNNRSTLLFIYQDWASQSGSRWMQLNNSRKRGHTWSEHLARRKAAAQTHRRCTIAQQQAVEIKWPVAFQQLKKQQQQKKPTWVIGLTMQPSKQSRSNVPGLRTSLISL